MLYRRMMTATVSLALMTGLAAGGAGAGCDSTRARNDAARTTAASFRRAGATGFKFDFGPGVVRKGYTRVLATTVYTKEQGYGFEPGSSVRCVDRGGGDALRAGFCTGDKPFYFSVALPEGNYDVTITFGDREAETVTTVKAELRRLMLERVETARGHFETRTFTVNVRTPRIAAGGEVKLKDREETTEAWAWDDKLTLEFNGARPAVCALEIKRVDVPTLFLLGDSTVCDQPREPYNSWGQMLTRFFKPGLAVANHAESGESLRSSLGARRLDKVLSLMRPGDYLFIQYGHNDEKEKGAGVGPFTTPIRRRRSGGLRGRAGDLSERVGMASTALSRQVWADIRARYDYVERSEPPR